MESVVKGAQHGPRCPCFFTGVTAPFCRPGLGIHKRFADVLIRSQMVQATPHTVGLVPSVPGHKFTGCQISKLIHLQPVGEILGIRGEGKVQVALEDLEAGVLISDSHCALCHTVVLFLIPQQIIVLTRGRCAHRAQPPRGSNARHHYADRLQNHRVLAQTRRPQWLLPPARRRWGSQLVMDTQTPEPLRTEAQPFPTSRSSHQSRA